MVQKLLLGLGQFLMALLVTPTPPAPAPTPNPDGVSPDPQPTPMPAPDGGFDLLRSLQVLVRQLRDMATHLTATKIDDQLLGFLDGVLANPVLQDFLRRLIDNEYVATSKDEQRTKAIVGLANAAPPNVRTAVNGLGLNWDKFIEYSVWAVRVLLLFAGRR